MYITAIIMHKFRSRAILPKMHFKEAAAMRIKNIIKGKSEDLGAAYCVRELSSMVSCLKRTDFDESPCTKEIATFQECVARESKAIDALRTQMREGAISPDAVKLSYKQLNNLFVKWPVPGAWTKKSWVLPGNMRYEDNPIVPDKK